MHSIDIHLGKPDFEFQAIRRIEATCQASATHPDAPTMDAVNARLREIAAGQGADAVIDVVYSSDKASTSWPSMTATGLAVRRLHDAVYCSNCTETIDRDAAQCRFCGHTLTEPGSLEAIQKRVAMFTPTPPLIAIPDTTRSSRRVSRRAQLIVLVAAGAVVALARAIFSRAK